MVNPDEQPPDDQPNEETFFNAVEQHLEDAQFRRRVMLFQRCDNALRPLLTNLEEIAPRTDEELAIYKAFLQAAGIVLDEMRPFLPPQTFQSLHGRLQMYEARMRRDMRGGEESKE